MTLPERPSKAAQQGPKQGVEKCPGRVGPWANGQRGKARTRRAKRRPVYKYEPNLNLLQGVRTPNAEESLDQDTNKSIHRRNAS